MIRDEGQVAVAVQGTLIDDVYQLNLDLIAMKERNTMILNGLRGLEAALEALRVNSIPRSAQSAFRRVRDTLRKYGLRSLEFLTSGAWRTFGWMVRTLAT